MNVNMANLKGRYLNLPQKYYITTLNISSDKIK